MARFVMEQTADLRGSNPPLRYAQAMHWGDDGAHEWRVTVRDAGRTADLSGMTARCQITRPATTAERAEGKERVTVSLPANIDAAGGVVSCVLHADCYAGVGLVEGAMILSGAGVMEMTAARMTAICERMDGDAASEPIPADELLAAIVERSVTELKHAGMTEIGKNALRECMQLSAANCPAAEAIRDYAFYQCSALESAAFPACTDIGSWVFYRCSALVSASFPACRAIGSYAFAECASLPLADFPECATIGGSAFGSCAAVSRADFPACMTVGSTAFARCASLETAAFDACAAVGSYAFSGCSALRDVSLPACTEIGNFAFQDCPVLGVLSLPACASIGNRAFNRCTNLRALVLAGSSVCVLGGSSAFTSTPIGGLVNSSGTTIYFGRVYVPSSLVADYQAATNWVYLSNQISAIEDSEFA